MPIAGGRSSLVLAVALAAVVMAGPSRAFDVVMSTQGEFMDAYLVDGQPFPPKVAFDTPDPADPSSITGTAPFAGRHLNGKMCFFPRNVGHNGNYVVADDTYREACLDNATPQARCSVTRRGSKFYIGKDPDGWAVFSKKGKWRRQHFHTAWPGFAELPQGQGAPEPSPQGTIDPQGCVFDGAGNMYGNDVGVGDPTDTNSSHHGSLLVFFPGPQHRYDTYCFLDKDLKQAGMPAMDGAGNIYIAETGLGRMWKYSPPFPTGPADCPGPSFLVSTPPTKTQFVVSNSPTPAAIVRVPGTDHWYIDSVLLPGVPGQGGGSIDEYDANGVFVRNIVPTTMLKNPLGMDVGSDGTLYFAELNLNMDTSTGCGRASQVRFVNGTPQAPEVLGQNLSFPDGITVVDSTKLRVNFLRLPVAVEPNPSTCGGGG